MSKGLVKAVVGAVLALALAMTALLFNGYRSGRSVEFTAGAESADAPVQVLLLIREVDPVKGELRMRVFVTPGEGEDAFTTAYVVETSSEVAKEPLAVGAGKASASTDVVVSFDDGEELMYPFDRYRASVDVVAREAAVGSEADGSADAGAPVPVALTVESANAGFRFDVTDESEDDGSFGAVRVDVRRSAVPVAMAIVMSIVMLCLAGIVSAVSHLIVTGRRRFEFASLTWMAAMLFAFVGFRNAAPGSPTMGSLFDFLGFFWAELAVAVSLIRVGMFYVRKHSG